MKKYSKIILSAILVAFIIGSIQSIAAIEPELDEDNIEELYSIFEALVSEDKLEESLVYIDKILLIEPEDTLALTKKAIVLYFLDRDSESVQIFDKVLSLEPNNVTAKQFRNDVILRMLAYDAMIDLVESLEETMYGKFILTRNFASPIENKNQLLNSEYDIHLLVVVRNAEEQLINVSESTSSWYLPDKFTDVMFDTEFGKKEITTINNIKYEKVQYTFTPTLEHRFMGLYPIFSEVDLEFSSTPEAREQMAKQKDFSQWKIHYCGTFSGHGYSCLPIFQDLVPNMTLEQDDIVTHQWTILRILN